MNLRIALFFFLLPVLAIAQLSNDVLWAVDNISIVSFDQSCATTGSQLLSVTPMKVVQTDVNQASSTPFRDAIIEAIEKGVWPAFADTELTAPMSQKSMLISYIVADSVVTFDPETYEEKLVIVSNNILEEVRKFKVRQRWTFDEKNHRFLSDVVAISPYLQGSPIEIWFKMPDPKKKWYDIEQRRVHFSSLLDYQIEEEEMIPVKGTLPELKAAMLSSLKTGRMTGYRADGSIIALQEVPDIFINADTIYTIDPESYEAKFEIVEREYRSEDINDYQISQSWFFEPRNGYLQSRAERVAPVVSVTDEYGTLSHYLPLFFWQRM